MYPVAIALLGAAGAWLAWKRNPLFSSASSLRLLGVAILSLAASVLLVVAAVDRTSHRAEPVLFTTLLTVVILGTLAMLYVTQIIAIPKAAQLTTVVPPTAKPVHFHRQQVYYRGKIILMLLVVCAVLGAMSPRDARYVILSCGAMLALLAAVVLPATYANAVRFDRSLSALECDPWVHWRYSAEQWKSWSDAQRERLESDAAKLARKRYLRTFLWALGLIAAGVLVFSRGSLAERVDYTVVCFGGIALTIILGSRLGPAVPQRLDASRDGAREAYFGPDGMFMDGVYSLWLGVSIYLVSAAIDERAPRSLLFNFEKIVLNPYGANQVVSLPQCVPIPEGRQSDLERLQRELKLRCPKARIALA